jgi:hypothetical protein
VTAFDFDKKHPCQAEDKEPEEDPSLSPGSGSLQAQKDPDTVDRVETRSPASAKYRGNEEPFGKCFEDLVCAKDVLLL